MESSPSRHKQFDIIRRNPLATLDIIAFVLPPFDPQNRKPSGFSFDYISLTATTTNFGVGVSKGPALPSFRDDHGRAALCRPLYTQS
jgi:hypothetical protein